MGSLAFLTEVIDVEFLDNDRLHDSSPDNFETSPPPSDFDEENTVPLRPRSSAKVQERESIEANLHASHQTRNLFRSNLSVVTFHTIEYLIGVQVARRLKRKTFNMYRCMKKKKIELRRATQDEVDYLTMVGAVHPGTHSITLVPFDECLCFVADALFRHIRFPNEDLTAKRRKSFVSLRPRIHRRKPLPWDIQRSVRKHPVTSSSLKKATTNKMSGGIPSPLTKTTSSTSHQIIGSFHQNSYSSQQQPLQQGVNSIATSSPPLLALSNYSSQIPSIQPKPTTLAPRTTFISPPSSFSSSPLHFSPAIISSSPQIPPFSSVGNCRQYKTSPPLPFPSIQTPISPQLHQNSQLAPFAQTLAGFLR